MKLSNRNECTSAAQSSSAFRGDHADFLAALLATESGIDPEKFLWYVENLDREEVAYAAVASPGHIIRHAITGSRIEEKITVREYFRRLGVLQLFNVSQPSSIKEMQYQSTNALGFIGYQLGEAILISAGYYRPSQVEVAMNGEHVLLDSYYVGGLPDGAWSQGVRQVLHRLSDHDSMVLATDVNLWQGKFTGKGGVFTVDDLKDGGKQTAVVSDILRLNKLTISSLLQNPAMINSACVIPQSGLEITLSGVLAAAHLCGAWGVANFLNFGMVSIDEFGTSILLYLQKFSGYEINLADVPVGSLR